jgi:hypothetical protein
LTVGHVRRTAGILDFLVEQLRQVLIEVRTLSEDVNVLAAITRRLVPSIKLAFVG